MRSSLASLSIRIALIAARNARFVADQIVEG